MELPKYFALSYSIDLGNYDTSNYDSFELIIYVLATLINPIIMISLLISIISNIYDKVQFDNIVSDRKELAKLILEGEKMNVKAWTIGKQYLKICTGENGLKIKESWNGIASKMDKVIKELKSSLESTNEKSTSALNELRDKIKAIEKTQEQKDAKTKEKADLTKKLDDIEAVNEKVEALKALIEDGFNRIEALHAPNEEAEAPEAAEQA